MPIRNYPVQENGNGANDLTKIGNTVVYNSVI